MVWLANFWYLGGIPDFGTILDSLLSEIYVNFMWCLFEIYVDLLEIRVETHINPT